MNCKPGDLAIVTQSYAGNEGKIVRCVRSLGPMKWNGPGNSFNSPGWEIEPRLLDCDGRLSNEGPDCCLRPIRDNDGEDETLTWAGLPHKEHA